MQATLILVGGGVLAFLILNLIGPIVAAWDWIRSPDRVRFGK